MTSFDHLTLSGSAHHLVQHLGKPETTIVAGEWYITREPGAPAVDRMAPDLLIAFQADPQAYWEDNGYVISVQGKPPRLRHGDSVPEHRQAGRGREEDHVRRPGNPRILAVRRRPGNSTAHGWPETGWYKGDTRPSPSRPQRMEYCRATATCSTSTSAGNTGN